MKELWKPFRHGYYEVSNLGRVRRVSTGRILKQCPDKDGYLYVNTSYHGEEKTYVIHRLVARKFLSSYPLNKEVHHKDENKTNNHWDNLEYKTHVKHISYHTRHGAYINNRVPRCDKRGELNGRAKLSIQDVIKIRKLFASGRYHKYSRTLARKFDVSKEMIYKIVTFGSWKEAA